MEATDTLTRTALPVSTWGREAAKVAARLDEQEPSDAEMSAMYAAAMAATS